MEKDGLNKKIKELKIFLESLNNNEKIMQPIKEVPVNNKSE